MEIENLKTVEDTTGGDFNGQVRRFAVEIEVLRGTEGLKCVGHGKRQAGEGLAIHGSLRFRN